MGERRLAGLGHGADLVVAVDVTTSDTGDVGRLLRGVGDEREPRGVHDRIAPQTVRIVIDTSQDGQAWGTTEGRAGTRRIPPAIRRRPRRGRPEARELVALPAPVETAYEVWEVGRALDELPDDDRDLIRLSRFEGLTQAEIAHRLGVPVGTVKSRTFRAHRRLAGLLGHLREPVSVAEPSPRAKAWRAS